MYGYKYTGTALSDEQTLKLLDKDYLFIETPGHSPGSTCIFFNDSVFTGDTILNNTKTTLNFPHSNRKAFKDSINKLKRYLADGMTINPGHGVPFIWSNEIYGKL